MTHLLHTQLDTLAAFLLLPAMLGLLISGARDAVRRERRYQLTGAAWLDSLGGETTQGGK